MSVRKIIRNRLRKEAEEMGVNSSRYVSKEFDRYQVEKYGFTRRIINKAKGTHKRKTWRARITEGV
jgi:hypothetical protein